MDWKVRFIDYPAQFQKMEQEIMSTIKTVLSQGDLMLRRQLADFEDNLASFVGTKYAVGVSSGTDALHLTLRAAGVGPGDEVITVSHTFVATAAAIHHAGAIPVLVDIGDDRCMNVELVEAAITPLTKAIIPVHVNGRLCDTGNLTEIAQNRGLLVIEDAAQAMGASFSGTRAGSIGLAGCFSFYPAKLLGAFGDGGAVVTSSDEIADKLRLLRNHGRTDDGDIALWSFNSRLDNLQAAILDLKLRQVPDWIAWRREIAALYHQRLSDISQIDLPPPPVSEGPYFDAYQNYEIEAEDRDRLVAHLNDSGIEVFIQWGGKGVHQFKALGLNRFDLPRTERLFQRNLMLPMHTELSDDQVKYVADTVRDFYTE